MAKAILHASARQAQTQAATADRGWITGTDVMEDRVIFTIYHDGEKVCSAYAWRRDLSDLGTVQSISYAAHMAYKYAEQKKMGETGC